MVIEKIYEGDDTTLKEYLGRLGLSRAVITRMKRDGMYINGNEVTVRFPLKSGDAVRLCVEDGVSHGIDPIDIPLKIIYEDDDILAVDKPTSMPTHPSRGNSLPTLANAVMARYGGNFVFRAITRLDRDTSGIVLIAKNSICAGKLSRAMKNGEFVKKYVCTVEGIPEPREGVVDAPIERESADSVKRIVTSEGKPSKTGYRVIKEMDDRAVLEVRPYTGRTHQIRVHMAYIGHPLCGDFLYGKRNDEGYKLRCVSLTFPHPTSDKPLTLTADDGM